ncbi:hypothetical protein PG985_005270 [Apiospora marii]|uniref:uncharacterized protein n=1 Tax=Apiospora marii TaxID=335849 RepID=UPI0031328F2B
MRNTTITIARKTAQGLSSLARKRGATTMSKSPTADSFGAGVGGSSSSYADERALNRSRSRERSSRRRYYSPSQSRRSYYDDETFYSPPPPRRPTPPQEQQQQQPLFNPPPPIQITINNHVESADFSGDASSDDSSNASGKRRRRQQNRRKGERDRANDAKPARQSPNLSDAPIPVRGQTISGEQISTGNQYAPGAQAVLARKGVNAIWDPSQNSDITVHLKLPLREEGLDEQIEEFCRLRRLGDFASAKRFFAEKLADHHDNPYLLVQYAEMLLEQGDYITLAELNGHAAFAPDNHLLGGQEGALLREYWKLLQLVRSLDCPPTDWGAVSIIPEALKTLHDAVLSGEGPVGSTEIKVLAVILGLAGIKDNVYLQTQWLRRQLARFFPEAFYRQLYTDLLRDGRVWDFHDIFISKAWADGVKEAIQSFAGPTDSQKPLTALLDDWKSPVGESDGSTALALLNMLLSVSPISKSDRNRIYDIEEDTMALATQTATSVMKSNPELMDSQPFMYWMLRKSGNALLQNGNQQSLFYDHLQSQPGISASFRFNPVPGIYHHRGFGLPEYTPAETENPGWRQDEAPAEYRAPAKLVLKQAKRFENYRMQSQALTNLILFSKSPTKLFGELCTLQRSVQGDIKRYAHTLGSTYLALDADSSTDDLKHAIMEVFYEPESCLTTHEKWYQGLLLYSLETDPAEREKVLELAFDNSRYLSKQALALLDSKMPEIRRKRMEYLEAHISSETDRRQAEKGICSSLRLREAMELPEFPELEMEEQPEKDTKKSTREETTKSNEDKAPKQQDGDPSRDPVRQINEDDYGSDTSHLIRRERSRRRRHRREKERSEELRIARERDHEMELKLQRLRHELDVAKIRQETDNAREKRLSEDRSRQEMEALRKELRELQRRHDRDELEEHHKLEEQLKQSQAKVEEMRREEQEQARRERLERDAVERYKRESAERRSHEDLMRELREVRAQMAEVKSAMKPQPQGTYLPEFGESPLGPVRLPGYPAWRRKHLRVPPRVIKVNYVPSSSSSSDSSSDVEDADFRDAHPTGGEVRDTPPDRDVGEANYHRSVEELDSDNEPDYPDDIDLEAGRMDIGEEKLGE